jgi:hypothetical protein
MPHGFSHNTGAQAANTMVSRCILLKWVAGALGHLTILEQPTSSLMQHHMRFQHFLAARRLWLTKHTLGMFGAESTKPIMLFCNQPILHALDRHRTRDWNPVSDGVCVYHTDEFGIKRSTGAAGLKDTQAYPDPFGVGVAAVFDECRPQLLQHAARLSPTPIDLHELFTCECDPWVDANLCGPFRRLVELNASLRR